MTRSPSRALPLYRRGEHRDALIEIGATERQMQMCLPPAPCGGPENRGAGEHQELGER